MAPCSWTVEIMSIFIVKLTLVTFVSIQEQSSLTSLSTEPSTSSFTFPTSIDRSPFWANDSLVGREVECGDQWKMCLLLGRLLHNTSGRCYPLGHPTPCRGRGSLVLGADALQRGLLRAVCRSEDSCRGLVMAYDGKCYDVADVVGRLCKGGAVVRHPFGGWECSSPRSGGAGHPSALEQPGEAGRCVLPPFSPQEAPPFRVRCDPGVRRCLRRGLLPYEGACFAPLSNATCGEGEWLALNQSAAEAGLLSAVCAARRPCGEGAHRLLASGRCHSEEQLRESLCPGSALFYAAFGAIVCSESQQGSSATIRVAAECENEETVHVSWVGFRIKRIQTTSHNCSRDNSGLCQPPVVLPDRKGKMITSL